MGTRTVRSVPSGVGWGNDVDVAAGVRVTSGLGVLLGAGIRGWVGLGDGAMVGHRVWDLITFTIGLAVSVVG